MNNKIISFNSIQFISNSHFRFHSPHEVRFPVTFPILLNEFVECNHFHTYINPIMALKYWTKQQQRNICKKYNAPNRITSINRNTHVRWACVRLLTLITSKYTHSHRLVANGQNFFVAMMRFRTDDSIAFLTIFLSFFFHLRANKMKLQRSLNYTLG